MREQAAAAANALRVADSLLICAGAGMGVDSGLPDFRGNEGLWRAYPALEASGVDFVSIANPAAFRTDPSRAWGFYGHRLALYRSTRPHIGFDLLRRFAARVPRGAFVFTSNVDGAFQQAGFEPERICECHGSIHWMQCSRACSEAIWAADDFEPEVDIAQCRLLTAPPACPGCRALARPNILMFGDDSWIDARQSAQSAALADWFAGVERPAVIELGAGTAVPTVRWFAERAARSREVPLIRINPLALDSALGDEDAIIAMKTGALEALGAIAEALRG